MAHAYSPPTLDALVILGAQIATARRGRRWTAAELAERAGISLTTLRRAEQGAPSVAIGVVFELATLVGVPLFGQDASGLRAARSRAMDLLALLPQRVRETSREIDDDF
ncbi:helix-turn-helix domain-containing protein [Oerskovia sp. NPDC060338]|uniref:helix-turn-helix domain-containing protein n=1 Tax=Oerskovia sp. NPDC060338 TaxID=3347100 RepID=UPI0036556026